MKNKILLLLILIIALASLLVSQSRNSQINNIATTKDVVTTMSTPLITFVELGSVRCIPCNAMQPVMRAIEGNYGSQIKIIFYDVWKQEQAYYARYYKIRLIPTQVFLDGHGKELMRHEGFFPEKEIDSFLQSQGLKPKSLKEK